MYIVRTNRCRQGIKGDRTNRIVAKRVLFAVKSILDSVNEWCETHIPGISLLEIFTWIVSGIWEILCARILFCSSLHNWLIALQERPKKNCRILMLTITAVAASILFLIGGDWNPVAILDDVPFWEFSVYITETGKEANNAYIFGTVVIAGASTYIANQLQKYVIGEQNSSMLTLNGFCFWGMNIYIMSLCSVLVKPLEDWYAANAPAVSTAGDIHFSTGILRILAVIALIYAWSDSVKNTLAIYFSIPCFYIFIKLKLGYVILFIFFGFDYLAETQIFTDANTILCIALAVFTQILLDALDWIGILKIILTVTKKVFLSLPLMFPSLWILITVLTYVLLL